MADARDYVLAIENNKPVAAQIATDTANSKIRDSHVNQNTHKPLELRSSQIALIDVVQSLGEYINAEDPKIRGRAISYLTAVITALPPNYLTRQQVQVLSQFLCDRIEDGGALEGLAKLQGMDKFTNDMVQAVVRA